MSDHSLTLGSLYLTGSLPDDDHDFVFNVVADGVSFGVAQGVKEIVLSLLSDGDLTRTTRYGNREVAFDVEIAGPDLASVAHGEAALRRELGHGNALTWQPPDEFAVPTVFDVIDSEMSQVFNDLDELQRAKRTFRMSLTCYPFGRSANLTTVEALEFPAVEASVVFDTCDSATGWSATNNGASAPVDMAWAAGAVSVHDLITPGPQTLTLTRTGAVDFTPTRYLEVEIGYNGALGALPVTCTADGSRVLTLLSQRLISTGRYRYTYDTSVFGAGVGADATSLKFSSYTTADFADLKIFNLRRTDMPPAITPRQLSRIVVPRGTERTPASIHAYSGNPAGGLGTVLLHTSPADGSGYAPPLRRWRTFGNTPLPASDTLSGSYEAIHPNYVRAEIPNSALPAGGYVLMAALKSDTAGTFPIDWSANADVTFGAGNFVGGSTEVVFFLPNVWHYAPLALLALPTMASTGTAKTIIDILYSGANPPGIIMDESWLFRVDDDCALTISGITPQHLWLDSPGVESSVPRVWWSDTADRVNQQHPGDALFTMGAHVLSPGDGTAVFMATTDVDYAPLEASFYDLWHSNAAE